MSIASRLTKLRESKGITRQALIDDLEVNYSTYANYEAGTREPNSEMLKKIANYYDVSIDYILGLSNVPLPFSIYNHPDILPIETKKIPLLGDIACGEPIVANQEYDSYVEVGTEIHVDYAVRAKGDSMVNARILDGDIVFIRQQDIVENGEIAAVIIGDEVTLKRFNRQGDLIILSPENNAMAPTVINLKEQHNIRILGKAIAFQSDVR